jgi:hypothetical protein
MACIVVFLQSLVVETSLSGLARTAWSNPGTAQNAVILLRDFFDVAFRPGRNF